MNPPSSPVCYAGQGDPAYHWARHDPPDIRLKRIYDPAGPADGTRILVDGLWPRGVKKADAAVDDWLRDVAPGKALRQWFGHDPRRWHAFAVSYREELADKPEALRKLLDAARSGPLTLVFAARDRDHNHAVVLRDVLRERLTEV